MNIRLPLRVMHALIQSNLMRMMALSVFGKTASPSAWGQAWMHFFTLAGPIWIKCGQMLATRSDRFSTEFLDPLRQLQDRIPAQKLNLSDLENKLGCDAKSVFSYIHLQPIASASIASVYYARMHTQEEVVIKILHPHIQKRAQSDLALLKILAKIYDRWFPYVQAELLIQSLASIVTQEMQLLLEAVAITEAAEDLNASPQCILPKVYWKYSRHDILVMSYEASLPLTKEVLKSHGIAPERLAKSLIELFMTQLFEHRRFHADLHLGNVRFRAGSDGEFHILLFDFGMMGQLSLSDRYYLQSCLQAILDKDYTHLADLHLDAGWIPEDTSPQQFAQHARALIEPLYDQALGTLSLQEILARIIHIGEHFQMRLLPELFLVQKSLIQLESLIRSLDPNFNPWDSMRHFSKSKWKIYLSAIEKIKARIPHLLFPKRMTPPRKQSHSQKNLICLVILFICCLQMFGPR